MTIVRPPSPTPLPMPPHYMRAKEQRQVRSMAETGPQGRPAGDHRSADVIIENSSTLRRFLGTDDYRDLGDKLKMHVGDWTEANPDPESRADAAYNLDQVLRFIDNMDGRKLTASQEQSGAIEGFSDYGYSTADNSEARVLAAFADKGYRELRSLISLWD